MIKNALFLFFVCAAVFIFYLPAYLKMQDLSEKNRSYQKKIVDLERENQVLGNERDRLVHDPSYFEKVAREKMGIIREDEVIYKLVPAGSKKAGVPVSDDEKALLKDPEDEAKEAAASKKTAATVKKASSGSKTKASASTKTGSAQKKTGTENKTSPKKKTSATMSKSKTGKTAVKTSSTESKTKNKSE